MELNFNYLDKFSTSVEALDNSIFHIRITKKDSITKESALDKYGYLKKVPANAGALLEENDSEYRINSGIATLIFNKRKCGFELQNSSGETLLKLKEITIENNQTKTSFNISSDENFVGFGDVSRENYFHRGKKITCWIQNVKSYICVPFFMSTKGYGLLLNTTYKSIFDLDSHELNNLSIWENNNVFDAYLFVGDNFKEILKRYTTVTGRPAMPPIWSLGLWHICNNISNAKDAVDDAYKYREHNIPCDVIGLEPGWMETTYDFSTKKKWDPVRFPLMLEPFKFRKRTFIDAIKYGMGYHFELWLCDDYDLTYEEERRLKKDFSITKSEVVTDTEEFDLRLGHDVYSDKITIPEEPWFEHLKSFVDWGADFFKTDASNQVNNHPDRLCGNKMTDDECHNFYPLMLIRQMYEGFAEYTNRRPFIFNPCGWTTFQQWAASWTGDTGGGASTLFGMLNTCFVGHTLTTIDMDANKVEGIHFGYLLPLSQINNYSSWKMPWLWGPKIVELHRFYSSLRSRLIPYIYSCMYKTTQTGVPFLLPLAMEFQDDPRCCDIKNEHLLGENLLVTSFTNQIYFPEGEWKDYWTGNYYSGNKDATIYYPENRGGGLFVRSGAIIPMGPIMQYRAEREVDEIELYCYPSREVTSFNYYEDDGISFDYKKGNYCLTLLTLMSDEKSITLNINVDKNSKVKKWSAIFATKTAPKEVISNNQSCTFTFDALRNEVIVPTLNEGETKIIF